MSAFQESLFKSWKPFCQEIFKDLKGSEELNLGVEAEDSLFLRFNGGKVRQNTQVEQNYMELTFQADGRSCKRKITLTADLSENLKRTRFAIENLRHECQQLEPDHFQVPMVNNGSSEKIFKSTPYSSDVLIKDICGLSQDTDLVGFFSGGPRISATANSKGQSHWFSTDNYFFDYSIYNGERAVSSNISGREWDREALKKSIQQGLDQLKHLAKPVVELKPGKYRTYLAPIATAEIFGLLAWNGMSTGAYKRGRSSLKKLVDGEALLSPEVSFSENFELGLSPLFNSQGEVSAPRLDLVKNGKFVQLLTSTRTAKEFSLESNHAPTEEYHRSLEMKSGSLAEADILAKIGTGLYLSHLHYLNYSDVNNARITGMTRYAALWVEDGKIKGPISNLRFDDSLFDLWGKNLVGLTQETKTIPALLTYGQRQLGGVKVPGCLIDAMNFTL